jgi:hypothetical protein
MWRKPPFSSTTCVISAYPASTCRQRNYEALWRSNEALRGSTFSTSCSMPQAWTKRVTDEAAGRLDRLVKAQMKQTAEAKELDGWLMINLGSQLLRGDDLHPTIDLH